MELFFEILGLGEKCSISIDGPPSALVADTDTTYLIFGGAAVFLVLCIIIVSILLCRKWSVAKYDAAINRVPEMSRPGSVPLSAGPISGKYTDKKKPYDICTNIEKYNKIFGISDNFVKKGSPQH